MLWIFSRGGLDASEQIVLKFSVALLFSFNFLYIMLTIIFYRSFTMSFIFQRIPSGSQIAQNQNNQSSSSNIFNFKRPKISNAKHLSEIQWKSTFFKGLNCFSSLLLIINVLLLNQYSLLQEQQLLHLTSSLFALCSVLFYLFGYLNEESLIAGALQLKNEYSSAKIMKFIVNLFFNLTHPNQVLSDVSLTIDDYPYKLNSILEFIVILRIFSIVYFLIQVTRFYGLRVSRVLDIYAVKNRFSVGYAIKCLFKQNSFKTPIFMLVFGLMAISFIDINFSEINGYQEGFLVEIYETVITMTTVGYGDLPLFYPSDRVKAVFVVILGSFISSVLTLTVLNYFKLTEKQHKAYHLHKRISIQEKIASEKERITVKYIMDRRDLNIIKDNSYRKDLIGLELPRYKEIMKESDLNESIFEFFNKNQSALASNIKKLVEKQLIIKDLMNFYFERRAKIETELLKESISSQDSPKSRKSKMRVQDSKRMMECFKKLLNE